jgi:prevent-host-death family protein
MRRFARERGVNWRTLYDIEKATRDGFMVSKLDELARAYEVTYDSLVAVGRGEAVELDVARPGEAVELVLVDDPSGEHLQEASIEKARAKLGDIIDHVRYTGDPVLITRHGKPAALITPLLGRSDYGSIDAARKLAAALGDGDARYAIADLLDTLDRYLVAGRHLAADGTGVTGA